MPHNSHFQVLMDITVNGLNNQRTLGHSVMHGITAISVTNIGQAQKRCNLMDVMLDQMISIPS